MPYFEETEFKRITRTFFDKEWKGNLDIFNQVSPGGEKKFAKFAEFNPQDYSRLDAIFSEKQNEVFYIKETDLFKYYQSNTIKDVLLELTQNKAPALEVFQKIYPVATYILQNYMEIPASDEFLALLDELPKALAESLESKNLPFQELFALTLKENTIQTHCVNVGLYCLCLARELGKSRKDREEICLGGILADIGKKFIPMEVLFKDGKLSSDEREAIQRHPISSQRTLDGLKCYSSTVIRMAGEHHENFDGTGYPMKIAGKNINTAARICKITDVFNALTSQRPYGKVLTPPQALKLMKDKLMGQFDPELLTAFNSYVERK
jgi:HD-GYP domain-containing protein (c-di-GMP phosphodiesterase class II)